MYNKKNMLKMFHEKSIGLAESMEHPNYYHSRILLLHEELKKRGIESNTPLSNLNKKS